MPRRSGCTVKRRRRIYIRRRRHNANSVIQLTRWKARLTVRRRGFEGLRIDSGIWWQIDRRDANLSNCTLGTRGCITSDLAVARVRTISAFQSVCSPMLLCPSGDKSICDPFTIPHCFLPHLRSTFGYEQRSPLLAYDNVSSCVERRSSDRPIVHFAILYTQLSIQNGLIFEKNCGSRAIQCTRCRCPSCRRKSKEITFFFLTQRRSDSTFLITLIRLINYIICRVSTQR